jgi:hypothetical protein
VDPAVAGGGIEASRAGDLGQLGDGAQDAEKNELQPWRKQCWCIAERESARFVAKMEDVLDVYAAEHSDDEPLVCMDEASKQLLKDLTEPIPMASGRPKREDYHYGRRGTQAIFCFFDPIRGWRRMAVEDSRTAVDWAEQIRILLEVDYPKARKVKLVCDNLNTHTTASLYGAFPAEQARALAMRLEIHYTPVHGSWLNVAEIELSVLAKQCLDRRIGSSEELKDEVAKWVEERNAMKSRVEWRFTTADARVKLRHLYPQFKD